LYLTSFSKTMARHLSLELLHPDEQLEQKSYFLPGAMRNREGVSHVLGGEGGIRTLAGAFAPLSI
jgi:hypothetical protein